MTRTILYKGKQYNGIFVSVFKWIYDLYIDRQARLAIVIESFGEVKYTQKLETYQIDILLDDEDDKFLDELDKLETKFETEMYNE